jgi:hypothetical protein
MGVRYTNGPIKYSTSIRSDSSAHLIADLDAVLGPCALARATCTGGFKYTLQSPDGLQMKVWVQDLGDHNTLNSFLRITPTSADELRVGVYAFLILDGRTFEAWANVCQFFVSPFGDAASQYYFACGILALQPTESGPCAAGGESVTVTEIWWSSASSADNFRNGWIASGYYALCYNGSLYNSPATYDASGLILTLLPFCSAYNVTNPASSPASIQKYNSGLGLRIDALLAQSVTVYGQLWDAHLYTLPATLDSTVALTDTDAGGGTLNTSWLAWNNYIPSSPNGGLGTVLATLFLLLSSAGTSIVNVAY